MQLPANLDFSAAAPLWTSLVAARGAPISIDASQVERVGGLCLQVLMAAAAAWRADGHELVVTESSTAFINGLRIMGAEHFAESEAAS